MKKPWIVVTRKVANEAREVDICREDALMPRAILLEKAQRAENARYQALVTKQIWAAGLDVFSQESVSPDHPLLGLPNLTALPHIGSETLQARAEMARLAAANIVEVRDGKEPLTPLW